MIVVCVILIYFFWMIFGFLEIYTKIMLKLECVSNECTNGGDKLYLFYDCRNEFMRTNF